MNQQNLEKIIIIDYGSQVTQLIARKVREVGVYSEIINFNQAKKIKKSYFIKGIIFNAKQQNIAAYVSNEFNFSFVKSFQGPALATLKYRKPE